MTDPAFLFDNRLAAAPLVASSTADGNKQNLIDWRPQSFWQPASLPATITGDAANLAWEFTNSLDGWGGTRVTLTANATFINVLSTDADPTFFSAAGQTIDGAKNRYLAVRIRRNASASQTWDGQALYQTAKHAYTSAYGKTIADPTSVGTFVVAIWDMWALTAGGDDWKTSIITRIRFDFGGTSTNDNFDIDWIAVLPDLAADYAAFFGHDLGSQGIAPEIRGSIDNFVADDNLIATLEPFGDAPLIGYFTPAQYRWWRINLPAGFASSNPSIGIAAIGNRLDIPATLVSGFDPVGRTPQGSFNRSVAGNPLGRTTDFDLWQADLNFEFVTWDWLRDTWAPAWRAHLRGSPFAFLWDRVNYPDDVILARAVGGYDGPHLPGQWGNLRFRIDGEIE